MTSLKLRFCRHGVSDGRGQGSVSQQGRVTKCAYLDVKQLESLHGILDAGFVGVGLAGGAICGRILRVHGGSQG